MHWNHFRIIAYSVIAAVILGIAGWIVLPANIEWLAAVFSLGLIIIGSGVNSVMQANHTQRKMEEIARAITNIERMQKEQSEQQKEPKEPHSAIIPALQAFSQLYSDYVTGQRSAENKGSKTENTQ